jgi:hypothetical protein
MRNIVSGRFENSRRVVKVLDVVLGGRDMPINVRTSVLTTFIAPVLTYGREVWGMDTTSGVNGLYSLLN